MATILDTGLLTFLTPVFVFILVFALAYAVLKKTKLFGESAGVNASLALTVALLLIIVPEARTLVSLFTPWFTVLMLLVLFIFLFFMALGVKEDTLVGMATKNNSFITFTVVAILILFLVALSKTYGPFLLVNQEAGFWNAVKRTVFHPKMLGALLILVIAAYTVGFLSDTTTKK